MPIITRSTDKSAAPTPSPYDYYEEDIEANAHTILATNIISAVRDSVRQNPKRSISQIDCSSSLPISKHVRLNSSEEIIPSETIVDERENAVETIAEESPAVEKRTFGVEEIEDNNTDLEEGVDEELLAEEQFYDPEIYAFFGSSNPVEKNQQLNRNETIQKIRTLLENTSNLLKAPPKSDKRITARAREAAEQQVRQARTLFATLESQLDQPELTIQSQNFKKIRSQLLAHPNIIFNIDDVQFQSNTAILKLRSKEFETRNEAEARLEGVCICIPADQIDNVSKENFEIFFNYINCETNQLPTINLDNLSDMHKLSERYGVPELNELCVTKANEMINFENVFHFLEKTRDCEKLQTLANEFISRAKENVSNKDFPKQHLLELLKATFDLSIEDNIKLANQWLKSQASHSTDAGTRSALIQEIYASLNLLKVVSYDDFWKSNTYTEEEMCNLAIAKRKQENNNN